MSHYRYFKILSLVAASAGLCFLAAANADEKEAPAKKSPPSEADKADGKADEAKAAEEARLKTPVAKVNGMTITIGDMEEAMAGQSPMFRQEFANPEKQKELLDRLVKTKLMAEEAKRRGYDNDPEVLAIAKNKLASLMHRKLVETAESIVPEDEDLKKYYDDHIEDYHKPEKMRARQILIKDKAEAEALLEEVLKDKPKLHEFRRIAKDKTEDEETKKSGGDLGFFPKTEERTEKDPEVPEPIVEAVFKLKKNGDIHPKLVETDKGYHIVMRTGHRKKMDVAFEDAKDRLSVLVKREMRRETVESGIEKLKEQFKTSVSEENLKHVVIDLSDKTGS